MDVQINPYVRLRDENCQRAFILRPGGKSTFLLTSVSQIPAVTELVSEVL